MRGDFSRLRWASLVKVFSLTAFTFGTGLTVSLIDKINCK